MFELALCISFASRNKISEIFEITVMFNSRPLKRFHFQEPFFGQHVSLYFFMKMFEEICWSDLVPSFENTFDTLELFDAIDWVIKPIVTCGKSELIR